MTNSVDDILGRNDLVYKVLPPRWVFGLPIGNGQIGGMIWVEDETKVVVTLDSVWAWDHRHSPAGVTYARFRELKAAGREKEVRQNPGGDVLPRKTYVGRLVIDVGQKISGEVRLRLQDAEVELDLRTGRGDAIHLKFAAYANLPAIVVNHPNTGIKEIRLERLTAERVGLNDAPEYVQGRSGSVEWMRQDIPDSPSIALGLLSGEKQSFTTVQVSQNGVDPVGEAVNVLRRASESPDEFLEDHCNWWRRFWAKSSVQVPDEKIEALWYMGLYMLASASRENGCAASLHGLWSPDSCIPPAHGFYIWDFYSQHWGLYTANHLELGEVFCDHFLSILPRLREQTRQFYEWDGVFVPGVMIVDGSWIFRGGNEVLLWPGATAWVAQAFWWQYLYSDDIQFLREKAYPFMRECMLFYERLLEKGEDGKYHLYVSFSPEFQSWIADDTLSLTLVRYLINAAVKAVEILEIHESHLLIWREMLENLQEYHVDESGLCLGEGLSYTESHRHMSHLGPIYPCDDLNIDGSSEDRQLIERSIENVILKGYGTFVGWAFVWLSAIAARVGRGRMAWWTLKQFADAFVSGNTYNLNLDWERNGISTKRDTLCVDGNMGAVDSLNQMLLQSWGGRIRVFPACPNHWRDIRFDNLRCEGGVEVSAVREDGRTLGVRLQSASGGSVRLVNPFGGSGGFLEGRQIQPTANGDLEVDLDASDALWLTATPEIQTRDLEAFVVERPDTLRNPYGLKFVDDDWLIENPDIPNVHTHFLNSFVK